MRRITLTRIIRLAQTDNATEMRLQVKRRIIDEFNSDKLNA
jgi:hypothetical protein